MKLKTLKDFNHGEYCPQCKLSIPIFDKEGLKQEAINWVKYYRSLHYGAQIPELLGEGPQAKALIDFFNITEADILEEDFK